MAELQLITNSEAQALQTAHVFEDADKVHAVAPALFATTAHPKMTDRYSFTNTYDILLHVHRRGFKVSSVLGGDRRYGKVMVRMRHSDYVTREYAPELVIVDSHDGTSRLKMYLGWIRFLCMNGMVAGDMLYAKSFVHLTDDLMARVLLELEDVHEHIDQLNKRVRAMQSYMTNIGERIALADAAVKARYGEERDGSFIADMRERMLHTRRIADNNNDLYTVMNVVQENILRGGMNYMTANAIRRVQPINSVNRNVGINQTIWQQAEYLMQRAA